MSKIKKNNLFLRFYFKIYIYLQQFSTLMIYQLLRL